ncbi:GNAT family N-acetyltransferase [Actinomadura kijaniata]|uniref:GNAT family N-acetyltransferase n=1 Tax=Actinomadura kijaniata TaxID=46161 RepID=UPI000A00EDCC|nr:GNAT family N-acetyltransferase [Actinomadura kijaniata]
MSAQTEPASPRVEIPRDPAVAAEVAALVNRVYAVAEEGLWRAGAARTTPPEVAGLIRQGEIVVARLDGRIVGCVRVQALDERVGEFGMLAADPAHRGHGIGRRLVDFAERLSRERGLTTMRLELLVPTRRPHPGKRALHAWYTRLGYRVIRNGAIEEQYPELAALLAVPCDYVIYHKDLGRA